MEAWSWSEAEANDTLGTLDVQRQCNKAGLVKPVLIWQRTSFKYRQILYNSTLPPLQSSMMTSFTPSLMTIPPSPPPPCGTSVWMYILKSYDLFFFFLITCCFLCLQCKHIILYIVLQWFRVYMNSCEVSLEDLVYWSGK